MLCDVIVFIENSDLEFYCCCVLILTLSSSLFVLLCALLSFFFALRILWLGATVDALFIRA
jgi:hypothetical protein